MRDGETRQLQTRLLWGDPACWSMGGPLGTQAVKTTSRGVHGTPLQRISWMASLYLGWVQPLASATPPLPPEGPPGTPPAGFPSHLKPFRVSPPLSQQGESPSSLRTDCVSSPSTQRGGVLPWLTHPLPGRGTHYSRVGSSSYPWPPPSPTRGASTSLA